MSAASYSAQLNVRKKVGGPIYELSDHSFQLTLSFEPVLFGLSHRLKHCTEVCFELLVATPCLL